jgi:hypothetical protein
MIADDLAISKVTARKAVVEDTKEREFVSRLNALINCRTGGGLS